MADEIQVSLRLLVSNGDYRRADDFTSTFDQAAIGESSEVLHVGPTGEKTLDIGEITTEGVLLIKNLDATTKVYYGKSGQYGFTINPGECHLMRQKAGVTIGFSSGGSTASSPVKIQYWLLEN